MSRDLYELIALAARYFFAGLMLLIVLRAARITLTDSRRAKALRKWSPQTGLSGEMLVVKGGERAVEGMRYPVIREGMIGSSRNADMRVRHSSVRRRHAYFERTKRGVRFRAHGAAPIFAEWGERMREIELGDGDKLILGEVTLMLILSGERESDEMLPPRVRRAPMRLDEAAPDAETDDFDSPDTPDDALFEPENEAQDYFETNDFSFKRSGRSDEDL